MSTIYCCNQCNHFATTQRYLREEIALLLKEDRALLDRIRSDDRFGELRAIIVGEIDDKPTTL